MTDRPILFSAPMVRALLDRRKTQTRRILKAPVPQAPALDNVHPAHVAKHAAPYLDAYCSANRTRLNPRGMSSKWCWWTRDDRQCLPVFDVRYTPGDRLWVKESWRTEARHDRIKPIELARDALISFDADYDEEPNDGCRGRNRVSIHMPRWASRLTLTVTGVRVQRLQECSEADAVAEGIDRVADNFGNGPAYRDYSMGDVWDTAEWFRRPAASYRSLWDRINGPGSWDANPWIVALTFTVEKRNIDA